MEKKIPVLMIVILIIGFVGGFILSYVVYQPQIQALTDDVASLEEDNEALEIENDELLSDLLDALSKASSSNNNSNSSETEDNEEPEITPEVLAIQDAQITTNGTHFELNFTLANSGTVNSAIIAMDIGQYPLQSLSEVTALVFNGYSFSAGDNFIFSIPVGASAEFMITLKQSVTGSLNLQSGDTIMLVLTSSQRYEYPITFNLP